MVPVAGYCMVASQGSKVTIQANRLDENLLDDFMTRFWGYGTLNGDFWFIGMEEGGGASIDEVAKRLNQWERRGRRSLEDLYQYHVDIELHKWFAKGAPLQSTWSKLIRVLLSAKGIEPDREAVREYQINKLGRTGAETCLLELLPLPSPGISDWIYGKHTDIPVLASRACYTNKVGHIRTAKLAKLISSHHPKFVIFYGLGYLDWWREVTNVPLSEAIVCDKRAYFGKAGGSAFAVTQHPVATGVTLQYFNEIGQRLAALH